MTLIPIVLRSIESLPDTSAILPAQFFVSSAPPSTGEKRLAFAGLQDAIHNLLVYARKQGRHAQNIYQENLQWVLNREIAS